MSNETIRFQKDKITLKQLKKVMRAYSRQPVINLDSWRKARTCVEELKRKEPK